MNFEWSDLFLVVLGIIAFFLLRGSKKVKAPKETTGDLLQVVNIEDDGLVVTEDGFYILYCPVTPVALPLKSPQEQSMIWSAFFDALNTLSHRVTFRAESHHYDIDDYFQEYKAEAVQTQDSNLMDYAEELKGHFLSLMEQQSVRDGKFFIRLEINQYDLTDFEVSFDSPALEGMLQRVRTDERLSSEEMLELARQELGNTFRVVKSYFNRVGIGVSQMDKGQVKAYLYRAANRDTSSVVTWGEMVDHGVFEDTERVSIGKLRFAEGSE